MSKKADVSPGTQPEAKPSEACEKPSALPAEGVFLIQETERPKSPMEQLYEQVQALEKRVEALEAGEFGK